MQGHAATEEDDQRKWDQEQASSFLAAFHQHGTSNWQKASLSIIMTHAHIPFDCPESPVRCTTVFPLCFVHASTLHDTVTHA